MAPSSNVKSLVDQMPDADKRQMYCQNIDKDKIDKAVAELCKGGADSILGVIDMLAEPGGAEDYKAHYALHCLAVHVCKLEDDKPRRELAWTLASQITGGRPKGVRKYLVRELQVAGGKAEAPALGKVLTDPELCEPAAQALVAIGDGAAEQLRSALPKVKGKCRVTVAQNLGAVGDAGSVDALKAAAGDADEAVRVAAAWALANIGDAAAADALIKAADANPGWERIQAAKACLLLAEKLLAAGKKAEARTIYAHLRETRKDPAETYIRQAAEKALADIKQ